MLLNLQKPLLYLITSGETTAATTPTSKNYSQILDLIEAAVKAGVDLVQLREKELTARVLYKLTEQAAGIVQSSRTRLIVNDRADIARSAGADGVHLTTRSLKPGVIRTAFGEDFLIGVSTHSIPEVVEARDQKANFAVFGPVFPTTSKQKYGAPVGLEALRTAVATVSPFPILALGGVDLENIAACFRSGAAGIAAIRLLQDTAKLGTVVARVHEAFDEFKNDGK